MRRRAPTRHIADANRRMRAPAGATETVAVFLAADTGAARASAEDSVAAKTARMDLGAAPVATAPSSGHSGGPRPAARAVGDDRTRPWIGAMRTCWGGYPRVYGNGRNLIILGSPTAVRWRCRPPGWTIASRVLQRKAGVKKEDLARGSPGAGNPGNAFRGSPGCWYLVGQQRQDERTYPSARRC